MQTHVQRGLSLLNQSVAGVNNVASVSLAKQIIASHHEHFDGGGYPDGLRGYLTEALAEEELAVPIFAQEKFVPTGGGDSSGVSGDFRSGLHGGHHSEKISR